MSEDFTDLGAIVDSIGHTVTLITPDAIVLGSDGFQREGLEIEADVVACSWPSNGREVEQLPSGERTKETRTFALARSVSEGDATTGTPAQRFREDGREYRVTKVAPWTIGGFHVAICVRVGP